MKAINGVLFSCLLVVAGISMQGSGTAQSGDARTQTTAHYQMTLDIGPLVPMRTPDQAATAHTGEVMIQRPGRPMPMMAMTDQGRPVTHHLEVAVTDKATGVPRRIPMPRITAMNRSPMMAILVAAGLLMGAGAWGAPTRKTLRRPR